MALQGRLFYLRNAGDAPVSYDHNRWQKAITEIIAKWIWSSKRTGIVYSAAKVSLPPVRLTPPAG